MNKRCAAILVELQEEGSVEFWDEFQFAPKQKLIKRLKDILEPSVDEKYYLSETAIKGFHAHAERMAERGNGFKFEPTDGDTVASSVTTRAGGRPDDNFVKVIGKLDIKGDDFHSIDGLAPTLNAGNNGGGQAPVKHLTNDFRIRKLTPLECWRLQDFPDEAHEKAKAAGVSDSRRFQQAGNSMTVAVVEMIFRQIDKALSKQASNTSLFGGIQ